MKSLNNYITEWKANDKSIKGIKKDENKYFVFETSCYEQISIFNSQWSEFKFYRDKVYIDGKNELLKDNGYTTNKYEKGYHYVIINNLNIIKNCDYMFKYSQGLISVPLFDTSKVESMKEMFASCYNLKSIPNFNTKNVKDMYYMFHSCETLEEIPQFKTNKVENMGGMFASCKELKHVPLFNVDNVIKMESMFRWCKKLSEETKQQWSKIYDFSTNKKK